MRRYNVTSENDKTIFIELRSGANINKLVPVFNTMARDSGKEVVFEFNGYDIRVNEHTTVQDAKDQHKAQSDANAQSPATLRREAMRRAKEAREQNDADWLCYNLPDILRKDQDALIEWIGKISGFGDKDYVTIDTPPLAKTLRDAGYDNDTLLDDNYTNKAELAEKMIALTITDFENGYTPYPHAMRELCKTYKTLPDGPVKKAPETPEPTPNAEPAATRDPNKLLKQLRAQSRALPRPRT